MAGVMWRASNLSAAQCKTRTRGIAISGSKMHIPSRIELHPPREQHFLKKSIRQVAPASEGALNDVDMGRDAQCRPARRSGATPFTEGACATSCRRWTLSVPPPLAVMSAARVFRFRALAERKLKLRLQSATRLIELKHWCVTFARPLSGFAGSGWVSVDFLMGRHPMTFARYAIFSTPVLRLNDQNQLEEAVWGLFPHLGVGHCAQIEPERWKRGGVDTHQAHLYRSVRAP